MISDPRYGWCKFKLKEFEGNPSYLTNVPLDLLEAFVNYWTNSACSSIFFDEEGTEFTLVINPNSIFIIEEKEEPKLIYIDDYIQNLTLELIDDIEKDINGWTNFITNDEEEDINEQRNALMSNLITLKSIVKDKNIKYIKLNYEEER